MRSRLYHIDDRNVYMGDIISDAGVKRGDTGLMWLGNIGVYRGNIVVICIIIEHK